MFTDSQSGQTGTFGGITLSAGYNNRLLPSSFTASSTNGTAMSLGFSYFANGNVQTVTNNLNPNRTESLTYDSLNRVSTAQSAATSGTDCWGQSIPTDGTGYDRYGNLMNINGTKNGQGCAQQTLSISVDAYNHASGNTYDAAGEVTNDGLNNYTFDAEGRMTAAGSTTYTFDGDGRRVKKSSGTLYWYGAGGSVLAETDSNGNTTNEYIFFAGGTARRDGSGNVYYYFGDQIGTSRAITNSTGSLCYDADFYPFGGERTPEMNTCNQNYKFAGMERDPETGNDHTQFRQYASNLGRWMSPDPLGGDISNPQSLNRYAYVGNNPCSATDPFGLSPSDCSFNITIVDNGVMSAQEAAAAQVRLRSLLAKAGVGVNFNQTISDLTLTPVEGGPSGVFGETPGSSGTLYVNNIRAEVVPVGGTGSVGFAVGTTAAHEFTHTLFGGTLPTTGIGLNHEGGWDAQKLLTPDLNWENTNKIHQACLSRHPTNPVSSSGRAFGGGGGTGGNGTLFGAGGASPPSSVVVYDPSPIGLVCTTFEGQEHCEFKMLK